MWLLVLVLAGLPDLARAIAHVWFVHRRHVLDHAVPDNLPKTAGEWLDGKLEALGLESQLSVIVTDNVTSSQDAFHVQRGVIQLTEETSFKRDPVYWAIAAHELGHARFRLAHPRSTTLTILGNVTKVVLVRFGLGFAVGNILFGLPDATRLAFWMLAAALVLEVFALADEALASLSASRMLREEPALERPHIRAAHSTLIAAFLTYLLPFIAHAVLLSQWWIVERITAAPRVPSGGVTKLGYVVAAIASLYIVLWVVTHLVAAVRASKVLALESGLLSIAWVASVSALILLGWDRHPGATHAWIVMVACSIVQALAVVLLSLPAMIALHPITKWARNADRGIERSSAFSAARTAGRETTKAGNRWWLENKFAGIGRVNVVLRLWQLTTLAAIPLVVAFWR